MEKERVLHTLPLHVSSLTMPLVLPILFLDGGGGKIKDKDPPLISVSLVWCLNPCCHLAMYTLYQAFSHHYRHGEICFRALTPH